MIQIKSSQPTQADMLLNYLEALGVEYIFGIPGGAIEPLYNALARNKALGKYPQAVIARHESGAAFMADGYSRATGKLGVCCATTGPGTTNLITGIANAYTDHIPLLVITPQTALPTFGKKGLQESSSDAIDTIAMLAQCTVYNSFISHVAQLEGKLYHAILSAMKPRRGPAHLSIPMDILAQPISENLKNYHITNAIKPSKVVDSEALDRLCSKMLNANKAVFFLGLGARHAIPEIIQFAEIILADIVMAPEAKGLIPNANTLNKGIFGFAGHQTARQTLTDSSISIILAIGTEFDELSTSGWDKAALLNDRLVHIDDHSDNFTHSPFASLHVEGDIKTIFQTLVGRANKSIEEGKRCPILDFNPSKKKHLPQNITDLLGKLELKAYQSKQCPIKPQRLMHCLNDLMPTNTCFLVDTGNAWSWATHYLNISASHHYHISLSFGAMGWAIGAAIGVGMANPKQPVCCITGDGSYLMSGQEITVAKEYNIPVIIIVLNDNALGMIKHGQALGGAENIGHQLPKVDYAMMARSMGINSITIRREEDIQQLDLDQITQYQGPTLIDVYIDPNEVPPMSSRMKVLTKTVPV